MLATLIFGGLRTSEARALRKTGATRTGPNDKVFATRTGGMWSRDNARQRIFDKAVELAGEARRRRPSTRT